MPIAPDSRIYPLTDQDSMTKSPHTHSTSYDNQRYTWDVHRLWELAKDLPVKDVLSPSRSSTGTAGFGRIKTRQCVES